MKSRTVLVVEDNPITRKLVRLTLSNEGIQVVEADTGEKALALVSKTPPDLILQDLLLPDFEGFDLVTELRAIPGLAGVPIIAFSGFLSRLEYGRAAAKGFSDFLPKPIEPSRLVEVVRAHLPPDLALLEHVGKGRHIVIADDDPVQLKLARLRLAALGFEVATAVDGAEALEIVQRGGIDAVISDVLMPRLDGFSLSTAIRKDPRFSQTPVILVSSSYVEEADRQLALNTGAVALVARTPELTGVIDALLATLAHPTGTRFASIHPDPTEHHQRVLRQLERQAAANAAFAHRSSTHATMLSVVAGISEALTKRHSIEDTMPDILASLLDASGVSSGALFVTRTAGSDGGAPAADQIVLSAHAGFSAEIAEHLVEFLRDGELFESVVGAKSLVVVGTAGDGSAARNLLARADAKSALLVPLVADQKCLGILLLSSKKRDLTEGDWIPFARTMAVQIGQALSVSRAFSKLAHSENRYRLLVEGASDGILLLDKEGHCRDLNPAMQRFLGRPKAEVIGTRMSAFVVADERERHKDDFGRLLENGHLRIETRRFTRPDGSVVIGDISATTIDVEGGVVLGILRDVTEKNRAEAEIRLLERLMLMASQAPDLVTAFEAVLRNICETSGWTVGAAWVPRSETGSLECACLWTRDPAQRARFKVLGEPVFATGEGLLGQAWASRKPVWVSDLASDAACPRTTTAADLGIHAGLAVPVIAKNNVIAVIEFSLDRVSAEDDRFVSLVSAACANLAWMIARKSAEDALRVSEARFARLAESGIIGITIANVDGEIHEANDAYLRMIGYSREELVKGAIRWSDIISPDSKKGSDAALAQLKEHGVAPAWETEVVRKDGTLVPLLVGVAMLDHPNCIAFTTDLTERKKAEAVLLNTERQLRQAQKMEAVGRLAGGIAHDFNNILSVILSYGSMIADDLKSGDPMRADVEQICVAGHRAAELTRQLLMFSRQQVIEPKVLDLNAVLTGMDKMLQRILGEDVDLVSMPNPSPGRVRVDPSGIEQIIMNLVVNARDAMPTGGKVTIETRNAVLDADYARDHPGVKPGPHVMLAVSDTGTGMDKETQAHIFEPFFTTKPKDKGTGLGLSTVYGIVQQSGGSISVYSEPGQGTSFKVFLPRVDSAIDMAGRSLVPKDVRGTETILLVEDESQVRAVAGSILRKQGYRLLEASHGGEALLICERHPGTIDLLVTDVVMPQMSGPELAKRLSVVRPGIKVLCMSGYTDDSVVRHGVLQADMAYLQKPITPESLARKVREVLNAPQAQVSPEGEDHGGP